MQRGGHQDAPLECLDTRLVSTTEVAAKEPGCKPTEQRSAKITVPGNRTSLEQGLAVPGAAEAVESEHNVVDGMGRHRDGTVRQRHPPDLPARLGPGGLFQP